ncbi:MAG: fold metallo-hydrolase [Anaerocolumna sp.]|jgi:competence protein ComEC|nr:fold metallo-hydrolase [Anaerocolumna sp.]
MKNKIFQSLIHILRISFVLAFILVLSGCAVEVNNNDSSSDLKVMYLDVGQGDAILIQSQGESMLIDAGEKDQGSTVINYLEQENIESLKYIICTHPHSDHIGGMAEVINEYKAEEIFLGKQKYDTDTYNNLIHLVEKRKITKKYPKAGDTYKLGDSSFEFLTPLEKDYGDNTNNYSLVIKMTNGKNSFLFTGDMEEEAEKDLLSGNIKLEADVLKVGHHGSLTSSSIEFLREVDPVYAVISVGKDNSYGHPSSITLANLEDEDVQVYRTDVMGTVIVNSDGDNITVKTENTYIKEASGTGEGKTDTAPAKQDKPSNVKPEKYVYITATGSKYHKKDCQYVKDNGKAILREEATEQGYEPCNVCKP